MNETMSPIVSSLIYRRIEPSETAAAATLAREVFDQFVAPYYQPEGVTEFHRYAPPMPFPSVTCPVMPLTLPSEAAS